MVLVDRACACDAAKRGGGRCVDLESDHLISVPPDDTVEALDIALSRLAVTQPRLAEPVQLRRFGGLSLAQCAEVLGMSARPPDTWWAYARAWLAVELKGNLRSLAAPRVASNAQRITSLGTMAGLFR